MTKKVFEMAIDNPFAFYEIKQSVIDATERLIIACDPVVGNVFKENVIYYTLNHRCSCSRCDNDIVQVFAVKKSYIKDLWYMLEEIADKDQMSRLHKILVESGVLEYFTAFVNEYRETDHRLRDDGKDKYGDGFRSTEITFKGQRLEEKPEGYYHFVLDDFKYADSDYYARQDVFQVAWAIDKVTSRIYGRVDWNALWEVSAWVIIGLVALGFVGAFLGLLNT